MKHLSMFMAGALALGMWSCASDEPLGGNNGGNTEGDIFAQLTLALPSSTRAITDTDPDGIDKDNNPANSSNDFEVGQDFENNVESLYVILAQESDGKYLYITGSRSNAILNQSVTAPTYSIQFQSEELETFSKYTDGSTEKEVYVFAYCNPSADMVTLIDNLSSGREFVDEIATLADTDKDNLPWAQKNNFTMTNALIAKANLPEFQQLISKHNTKATAFDLGTVKVERVVCRFDFQNKAADTAAGTGLNQYMIKDNVSGLNMAIVEMQAIALFNEAKEFYYLPRVSANADWTAPALCGYELVTNWMVSPNYAAKNAFAATNASYDAIKGNYFYNLDTNAKDLNYTLLSSLSGKDNDDWTGAAGTDYLRWRYATENTLPDGSLKHGITTGVAFRAEIKALDDDKITGNDEGTIHPAQTLKNAMATGETIYAYSHNGDDADKAFNNVMLGTAYDVWKYCYTHKSSSIRSNFLAAIAAGAFEVKYDGETVTTAATIFPEPTEDLSYETILSKITVTGTSVNVDSDTQKAAVANGFYAYVPEKDAEGQNHYYVYYRYYNRHNDNNDVNVTAPMEFATVRNNIYKLNVTTVNTFGLPGDLPTPPGTDDESPEVYFKVSIRVLPWVVRVNNIEF